ncbi:trypsin-like peptidase domain-containing protein [Candidatus Gottesmanbacteria bacterium]|nr:trypsin-like peptidase domain-containing protein [Candidatus Gottesmanbacteria bacterium]
MKRIIILFLLLIILLSFGASFGNLSFNWDTIGKYFPKTSQGTSGLGAEKVKIASEESVITDVVDKVSPSVVTVSIVKTRSLSRIFEIDPSDPFNIFRQRQPGQSQKVEQDIGTGFIVTSDGLIVTNKHVVSDTNAKYKIVTKDDKTYEAQKIYRDPSNDLAIIKIGASGLTPVTMGDSSKLKVGQMAIAIGTALGEFRNTVTVGVISGLGRGITAGSPFEGFVERLDNVIQTDAAINPGNSGGPLLNSSGQVIGVNAAVSSEGQNIGFALPINIMKDALAQFNKSGGKFERPFLGVRYKMITRDLALLNDVPEGAYVQEVVEGSPAEKGGVQNEDIITKIDGKKITDQDGGLTKVIAEKKVGERTAVEVWREGKTTTLSITVGENSGE